MRLTPIARILLALLLGVAGALISGALRWRRRTNDLRAKLVQGRFSGHADRGGMRISLEAEVEWQLPERPPYWRGRITEIEFQLAR